jgi:hypothetical protein
MHKNLEHEKNRGRVEGNRQQVEPSMNRKKERKIVEQRRRVKH